MSSKINKQHKAARAGKGPRKTGKKSKSVKPASSPAKNTVARIKGKGSYIGDIGSKLGSMAGGWLGSTAGNLLGSIFGSGTYKTTRNSLVGPTTSDNGPPSFLADKDGSMIVAHREFITDITSIGADFGNTGFYLNPGLRASFPWLSQIAINFEEYKMLGLVFEFKTTSATAVSSTNTALGSVIMATDYNADAQMFTSKQQMEAYQYSCSGAPAVSFIHPVECAPDENVLSNMYVREASVPAGEDQRFYDLGLFQLATVGQQAVSTVGELWVSYHVKLIKPKLVAPETRALSGHWRGLTNVGVKTITPTLVGSNIEVSILGAATGFQATFNKPGNYLVTVYCDPSPGGNLQGVPAIFGTNSYAVVQNYWVNSFAVGGSQGVGTPDQNGAYAYAVRVSAAGGLVTMDGYQASLAGFNSDIVVTVLNHSLTSLTRKQKQFRDMLRALVIEDDARKSSPSSSSSTTGMDESKTVGGRIVYSAPQTTQVSSTANVEAGPPDLANQYGSKLTLTSSSSAAAAAAAAAGSPPPTQSGTPANTPATPSRWF